MVWRLITEAVFRLDLSLYPKPSYGSGYIENIISTFFYYSDNLLLYSLREPLVTGAYTAHTQHEDEPSLLFDRTTFLLVPVPITGLTFL